MSWHSLINEEPVYAFIHAMSASYKVKMEPECATSDVDHHQTASTRLVPGGTETQAFEFVPVKDYWTEDGVKENGCDEAQESEYAAVKEDTVHFRNEPAKHHGTEVPECATSEEDQHQTATKCLVSGGTETQAFEFVAVKEEWTEGDVKENDCDEAQEPESAHTLGSVRFIQQGQERATSDKDSTISNRADEAMSPQDGMRCGDRGNEPYQDKLYDFSSTVISALPPEEAPPSDTQCIVDSDKNTPPIGRTSVYNPRNDWFCRDVSDTNCNRYWFVSEQERFCLGENGECLGPPLSLHNEQELYTCDICQEAFADKKTIRAHVQQHMRQLLLSCGVCHKNFRDDTDLKVHYRIHTGERPYNCSVCNKTFLRSTHLKQHSVLHTGERPYSCSVCQKTFKQKSVLHIHLRRHTGEHPYTCTICNKTFSRNNYLKQHTRVHTGEQPYSCNFCHKAFTQSSYLKVHVRQHTGERPYSCNVCQKTFTSSSALRQHTRIHTQQRYYNCVICQKQFTQRNTLKVHLRQHTGDQPYSCVVCHKTFAHSNSLNRHSRLHTIRKHGGCSVLKDTDDRLQPEDVLVPAHR